MTRRAEEQEQSGNSMEDSSQRAMSRQDIDQILNAKRKRNESKSCYPCRQRKVKCDHKQPCRTCLKRGHPEICVYRTEPGQNVRREEHIESSAVNSPSRSPRHHRRLTQVAESSANAPDLEPSQQTYSGEDSVPSIIRSRNVESGNARDISSILGLGSSFANFSLTKPNTLEDRWLAILNLIPHRQEVVTFFNTYKVSAYPFNPYIVDLEKFELDVCAYLNAFSAGEFTEKQPSVCWSSKKSIESIGLILAVLASGAHFSDLEHAQRSMRCQDFARRSFEALRLANFLSRPSMVIIQTILILCHTLQNNGQSDSAWVWVGTVARLAQTMGMHSEKSMAWTNEVSRNQVKNLWLMIVWQDMLLSMCHDRLPAVPIHAWNMNEELPIDNSLSYVGVMTYLSRLGLKFMNRKAGGDLALGDLIDTLTMIDKTYQKAQPYLQSKENCQNMQHHLERLALKLHVSHLISFVCRPAVKNSGLANNPSYQLLHQRARESLIEATRTFLDFQALSIVPMRNWSMIHAVIGSTLLLSIWEETYWDQECQELQQRVIEVFSAVESKEDGATSTSENSQWLSQRHIWALVSLRNSVKAAMERNRDTGQPRTENDGNLAESGRLDSSFSPSGFPLSYDSSFINDAGSSEWMNLSPWAYLDSIMNVPLFDLPETDQYI